jgi:hypothetical protein
MGIAKDGSQGGGPGLRALEVWRAMDELAAVDATSHWILSNCAPRFVRGHACVLSAASVSREMVLACSVACCFRANSQHKR